MGFLSTIRTLNEKLRAGENRSLLSKEHRNRRLPRICNTVDAVTFIAFIIIDRSGSMSETDYPPSRLQAAINAAVEYVKELFHNVPDAEIAVISFGDSANIVLEPTPVNEQGYIISKIQSISISGFTDINKGLIPVLNILSKYSPEKINSQIVLLTDGHGGNPLKTANTLKKQYNAAIDVVGIGGNNSDVNEKLLKKVATTDPDGVNHYRFIKDPAALKQHYRELATSIVWTGGRK